MAWMTLKPEKIHISTIRKLIDAKVPVKVSGRCKYGGKGITKIHSKAIVDNIRVPEGIDEQELITSDKFAGHTAENSTHWIHIREKKFGGHSLHVAFPEITAIEIPRKYKDLITES